MSATPEEMGARLDVALDLADLALEMYEAKLRREHPHLSDDEVAREVALWCRTRPGAEWGDAEGRRVDWPRRRPGQ
jgi:hypothetical protein